MNSFLDATHWSSLTRIHQTVYLEVFQEVFHFPPISTKRGRIMWYILGKLIVVDSS